MPAVAWAGRSQTDRSIWFWLYVTLTVLLLALSLWWRRCLREPGRTCLWLEQDAVVLAFVVSGRWRAFDSAVAHLLSAGQVEIESSQPRLWRKPQHPPEAKAPALAREMWRQLAFPQTLQQLETSMQPHWAALEVELRRSGVLHSMQSESQLRMLRMVWVGWAVWMLLQMVTIGHGAFMFLAWVSVVCCVMIGRRLGPTQRSSERIDRLREVHARLAQAPCSEELGRAVALFSLRQFHAHPILADYGKLRSHQRRTERDPGGDSGCSDTSACSGGGDGGDGGCGGGCGGD